MKLPPNIEKLTPYDPALIRYPVKLDANESFIPMPETIRQKIVAAVAEVPLNRYPDPMATDLCAAAADFWGVAPNCVVAGNGSDELIALLLTAFVPHGGRVLISQPDFSMYAFYADVQEAVCVFLPKTDGTPDCEAFVRSYRADGGDLIIFSNPCNPTGQGVVTQEIESLLQRVDCPVVVDEAYMDFWKESAVSLLARYPHLIILKTCSKAMGLAGIRLGFALGDAQRIDVLKKVKSPFNVNSITQVIGCVILQEKDFLAQCRARIIQSKQTLEQTLQNRAGSDYRVVPTQTNFVLLQTPKATQLYTGLLTAGVLVRKIGHDLLRITAGSEEENACFCEAFFCILKERIL